ncbi:MAG: TerC/Alx family metal homeostasis membrane protein [Opitutaceae bacterium]|jgi:tellurite resistance protein TerC|nr:TerC/Alx family metal homeostasis membrane protein [Opitutaceae bacterium]
MTDKYPLWAWIGFGVFITTMLALDLGVFNRRAHVVKLREAATWCIVWFTLAMGFNAFVWFDHGSQAGAQWFASYLVELGLSVDNVFVFIVVFSFFRAAPEHQHRVLFWGIVGAAVLRAVFIFAGIKLIENFEGILVAFGAFLIFTGVKLAIPKREGDVRPDKNVVARLFMRFFPVSAYYDGGRFFTKAGRRHVATPLFIVLLVIETTDVVFALDSIPAVLGITKVPFIAFTSNIFAILGLRSLYFALSDVMGMFRFLGAGLAVILVFIGVKMIIGFVFTYHVGIGVSLGVIGGTLALAVIASLLFPGKKKGGKEG